MAVGGLLPVLNGPQLVASLVACKAGHRSDVVGEFIGGTRGHGLEDKSLFFL
jgi:hypothetical protein